jgi:hypothetical protein
MERSGLCVGGAGAGGAAPGGRETAANQMGAVIARPALEVK